MLILGHQRFPSLSLSDPFSLLTLKSLCVIFSVQKWDSNPARGTSVNFPKLPFNFWLAWISLTFLSFLAFFDDFKHIFLDFYGRWTSERASWTECNENSWALILTSNNCVHGVGGPLESEWSDMLVVCGGRDEIYQKVIITHQSYVINQGNYS